MAEVRATFRVGRYRCSMSSPVPCQATLMHLDSEWEPELPARLTASELKQYRQGRDAFVAELSRHISGGILLLEA